MPSLESLSEPVSSKNTSGDFSGTDSPVLIAAAGPSLRANGSWIGFGNDCLPIQAELQATMAMFQAIFRFRGKTGDKLEKLGRKRFIDPREFMLDSTGNAVGAGINDENAAVLR